MRYLVRAAIEFLIRELLIFEGYRHGASIPCGLSFE